LANAKNTLQDFAIPLTQNLFFPGHPQAHSETRIVSSPCKSFDDQCSPAAQQRRRCTVPSLQRHLQRHLQHQQHNVLATTTTTTTMAPSRPILDAFCADLTIVVNQHLVMAVPMPHRVPTPRRNTVVVSAVLFVVAVAVGAIVAGICVGGGAGSHCPVVLARTKPAILPLPTTRPNVTNFDQSTTEDHVTAVTKFIRNITLTGRTLALANASSDAETLSLPEEWALYWLAQYDTPPLAPTTPQNRLRLQQRYALLTLIVQHLGLDSRDSETDVSRLYDLLSTHKCEWDGISCEATNTLEEEAETKLAGYTLTVS
jgi:hypothetical protein